MAGPPELRGQGYGTRTLGAGAPFAVKSVYDDNRAVRRRCQAIAKAAVARDVNDGFVRSVQRVLRDPFLELTEELQDAIVSAARAARQVADHGAVERERR